MKGLLLGVILMSVALSGCGVNEFYEEYKHKDKSFTIKTEIKKGTTSDVIEWKHAKKLKIDSKNDRYCFEVDGRTIIIYSKSTVIIEEEPKEEKTKRFTILKTIKVRIKATGKIISIAKDEFDPAVFEKIEN